MTRGVLPRVLVTVAMAVAAALAVARAAQPAPDDRRSGYDFMTPALRAMQDDETSNPGTLWPADARLAPGRARGEALFRQRMGQLDLSCAQCHDANAGRRLAGSVIPQGHPTGYPIYRLEWQSVGSLARRIRGCMTGVRAEPFGDDAPEAVDLELYLKQRAAGLPVETPAVRP